jgi:hypothetical protein
MHVAFALFNINAIVIVRLGEADQREEKKINRQLSFLLLFFEINRGEMRLKLIKAENDGHFEDLKAYL